MATIQKNSPEIESVLGGQDARAENTPGSTNQTQSEKSFQEEALEEFIAAGTRAWAHVPDAAAWVRELRGGKA